MRPARAAVAAVATRGWHGAPAQTAGRVRWPQGAAHCARQAVPHHRLQADAGLSDGVRAVCGLPARLFRLEHAASDHRADHATVDAEITGLSEQYSTGGIRRLVFIVDARARRPGSSLYLVTTFTGDGLAGNVGSLGRGRAEHARLDRDRLSPARRSGRHRASRAGAGVPASRRLPPAGRPRSRGARAAATTSSSPPATGRSRS